MRCRRILESTLYHDSMQHHNIMPLSFFVYHSYGCGWIWKPKLGRMMHRNVMLKTPHDVWCQDLYRPRIQHFQTITNMLPFLNKRIMVHFVCRFSASSSPSCCNFFLRVISRAKSHLSHDTPASNDYQHAFMSLFFCLHQSRCAAKK
jgi:hypothetical protein